MNGAIQIKTFDLDMQISSTGDSEKLKDDSSNISVCANDRMDTLRGSEREKKG